MFDVGFWEVALIGIVTLLVVGPDRLPEVARTAGKWVLKARRFVAGVKSDFNRELQTGDLHKILGDQKEQINELRSMVDSTRRDLETSTSDAVAAAKSKFESVEELGRGALSGKPSASSGAAVAGATISAQNTSTAAEADAPPEGVEVVENPTMAPGGSAAESADTVASDAVKPSTDS